MAPISGSVRLANHQLDLRDMLLIAGVGQYTAQMSIPYMNMTPLTTEPYAQGVLQLVKGLQRLLNRRGNKLAVDGGLGEATQKALMVYAGPRWMEKSWAQLYGDVINGVGWQGYVRNARGADDVSWFGASRALETGVGGITDELTTNPLVLAAIGFGVWWKFFRKGKA
ncbi:MAG TPA: hypothetical protein VFD36_29305 [Kofleriaceae bacterium]|nr:hypothetical protein [Kofleriaceae bacterium]